MTKTLLREYAARMTAERRAEHGRGAPAATPAEAEAEMVRVARQVAHNLSLNPKLVFGYHAPEDIEQEGVLWALEALGVDGRYDPSRPLENFLHVHVGNRLKNFRRKHLMRTEPPCPCCDAYGSPADPCKRWLDWHSRNVSKQNLMRPLDVSRVPDDGEPRMKTESSVVGEAEANETLARIDRELEVDLRGDYLRMLAREPVPKGRRQRVRDRVLEILS